MGERGLEVLEKYDVEILRTIKVRGAVMFESDRGTYLVREYKGTENRIELENNILNILSEKICVETYLRNSEGRLVTEGDDGVSYIVKTWHEGHECNVRDIKEVCLAVRMLAWLHFELLEIKDENVLPKCDEESGKIYAPVPREGLKETFLRHNRELGRVHTYIKSRKTKNSFERLIMESYGTFREQADKAMLLLEQGGINICESWCHGEFCHHNVVIGSHVNVITEFSHMGKGAQIEDLYFFMRKVLEKNKWDIKLAEEMLSAYNSVRRLTRDELNALYLLFLYPEKYWKQLNFYYNSNKAWIPEKNITKLQAVIGQQPARKLFLDYMLNKTSY